MFGPYFLCKRASIKGFYVGDSKPTSVAPNKQYAMGNRATRFGKFEPKSNLFNINSDVNLNKLKTC